MPRPEARPEIGVPSDSVRTYLREIARIPLLTASQEVDLAMRIESGEMALELLATSGPNHALDRRRFLQVVETVARGSGGKPSPGGTALDPVRTPTSSCDGWPPTSIGPGRS